MTCSISYGVKQCLDYLVTLDIRTMYKVQKPVSSQCYRRQNVLEFAIVLYLLETITETIQVTEGRKYCPRGPHVGQPCFSVPKQIILQSIRVTVKTVTA